MDRKTRFIIHGFIDSGEESWVVDMCKVGVGSDLCSSPVTVSISF
jgi:hypothetical protein